VQHTFQLCSKAVRLFRIREIDWTDLAAVHYRASFGAAKLAVAVNVCANAHSPPTKSGRPSLVNYCSVTEHMIKCGNEIERFRA
jgi:hypothetical protein